MLEFFVRILGLGSALRKVQPETSGHSAHIFNISTASQVKYSLFFSPDCSITKFLNRILGLEVHKQNYLFQYFTDNFDYLIEKDKKEGKYDMGILGLVATLNGNITLYLFLKG